MPYLVFSEALRRLEESGGMVVLEEEFSAEVEAPSAIRKITSTTGKAVLLRRIKDKDYVLASGVYYRKQPQVLGLGSLEELGRRYLSWLSMFDNPLLEHSDKLAAMASLAWLSDLFPRVVSVSSGEVEVIQGYDLDATRFPALKHSAEEDTSYVVNPVVLLKTSSSRSFTATTLPVGVLDERTLFLALPPRSRASQVISEAASGRGRIFAAVLVGAPPPLQLAASMEWVGYLDFFLLSGLLVGSPVPVARFADNTPLPVGAEVVFIGEIEPGDSRPGGRILMEDNYLAQEVPQPVVRLRRVILRKNPVFYTSIVDREASDIVELSRWRDFLLLAHIRRVYPFVKDLRVLPEDAFRTIVISVDRVSGRELLRLGMFVLSMGASPRLDTVILVDRDVDVNSPSEILRAIIRNVNPDRDVVSIPPRAGSRDAEVESYDVIVDATSSSSKALAGSTATSRLEELARRLAPQHPTGS
uniref:UbiD family decarboxylase n=1 Tax=Thermofilum pendens TaxID=2269 RepID=A0A7C3WKN4_THEPE